MVLYLSDCIFQNSDPVDLTADDVAGFEEFRRIHSHTDSGGRSHRDYCSGFECDALRQISDCPFNGLYHPGGYALLPEFSIYKAPDA